MGELLSLLPGCLVIGVILAAFFIFYRRRQNQQSAAFGQAATQAGLTPVTDETALRAFEAQLARFAFGQRGGKTIIRSAVEGAGGVVLHVLQTRAAPGSDSDEYFAYLTGIIGPAVNVNLALRVQTTLFDNSLNQALYGSHEALNLTSWPALGRMFRGLGTPTELAESLLAGGLGQYMASEAEAGRIRNVELVSGRLLVYELPIGSPAQAQLAALQHSGRQIASLISKS